MIKVDLNTKHPAQRASFLSPTMVKQKKRDEWLALFADDAIVQDPVGPSAIDPTGEGHKGKAAIAAFYDNVAGAGDFDFEIEQSFPCGDECANVWFGKNVLPGGIVFKVPMVTIYKVNAEGKIISLRAFWDSEKVAADLQKVMGSK